MFIISLAVAIVTFGLSGLVGWLVPQIEMNSRMAVTVGQDHIQLSGSVGNELHQRMQAALEGTPNARYIYLGSNRGGDVPAMLKAFPLFLDYDIQTAVVGGTCNSACAFLALMFPHRLLADGASLGFHNVYDIQNDEDAKQGARDEVIKRAIHAGVPETSARKIFGTVEIYAPPAPELLADGYITGCWDRDAAQEKACNFAE